MEITVTISGATLEQIQDLFARANTRVVERTDMSVPSKLDVEVDCVVEDAPAPEPEPEPEPAKPVTNGTGVQELIEKLDAKFTRAKTVTLSGGAQGKEDDEVVTPDGEIGIIAAVWRGRAVIEFEDGRGEEFKAVDLKLHVAEAAAAPEPKPAPEPEPEGDGPSRRELTRALDALEKAKGKEIVNEILHEFYAKSVDDIEAQDYAEVLQIVKDELEG